jgi:ABC-type transport system involved in multi-copper enzyme maturation permease subunit
VTTLTVPASLEEDASLRPVPWRRMAWVTWRQHRIALAGVAAFLGALAVWLWIAGTSLRHAYAAATACHLASPTCADLITTFNNMNQVLIGGYVLQAVPALIGAFAGAPLLARELETGTFRYAWTQGFGRWRWTLAKLVPLAAAVAAAAGAISVLFSWYYQPYFATGNQALSLSEAPTLAAGLFDLRGVAFAAWTLAAFAIGALAGMLIRRVVPAIVATLAAYTGLALVAGNLLRQHYLTPLVTSNPNVPGSALVLSQWWTHGGIFAFAGQPSNDLLMRLCPNAPAGVFGKPLHQTFFQCLAQHGYTTWTSYQPASRFWLFQSIEGGWLLALSVVLTAVTVWLVRRRVA